MKPTIAIKPLLFISILLCFTSLYSCLKSTEPGLPDKVLKVLNETGFNRIELTKTIAEFIDYPDELKLSGAYYLISNMDRQYYVDFDVKDTLGNIYSIDPMSFGSESTFLAYWKKLDTLSGGLKFKARTFVLDTDTVESSILVSRINRILDTLTNPYLDRYPIDIIFECALPYRIANEAIENWQNILLQEYPLLFDHTDKLGPDSMISLIDSFVKANFRFDGRFVKQSSIQPLRQLIMNKAGSHEDLAQLKVKMLRTAGIPAVMDYVPYLADSVNGFHWASAMQEDLSFKPLVNKNMQFLFRENNLRIPKIYRRVYTIQPRSLFRTKETQFFTPPFLGHYDYLDVTEEYFSVVHNSMSATSSDSIIYLAVYNDSMWKAIDYAVVENNIGSFKNIRPALMYKPAVFKNDSIILLN